MYRWWGLAVLACLAGALAVPHGRAVVPPANPEDGKVAEGRYTNEYFKIAYPLPADWSKDWEGPPPSSSGYYVLTALKGSGRVGTMLIAAQDQFFAAEPLSRSAEMVDRLRRSISEIDGMTVDREPEEMMISGRQFTRLDFSGAGLYRMVLITESRCHFVSFNLTTADPRERASLAQSLKAVSLAQSGDPAHMVPVCVKNYATPEHLLSRIDPPPRLARNSPLFRCASSSGQTDGLGTFMSSAGRPSKRRRSRRRSPNGDLSRSCCKAARSRSRPA